jgi:hypothetical protein
MSGAPMIGIAQGLILDRPLHEDSDFRVGAGLRPALVQSIGLLARARHA